MWIFLYAFIFFFSNKSILCYILISYQQNTGIPRSSPFDVLWTLSAGGAKNKNKHKQNGGECYRGEKMERASPHRGRPGQFCWCLYVSLLWWEKGSRREHRRESFKGSGIMASSHHIIGWPKIESMTRPNNRRIFLNCQIWFNSRSLVFWWSNQF